MQENHANTNIPSVLVIFGATGDLVKKKLAPALFSLFEKGKLPDRFKIVGFSRRDWTDAMFREYIASILVEHHKISPERITSFLNLISFERGNFEEKKDYHTLATALKKMDDRWGVCTNKLFFLAVAPDLYKTIFTHLASSGLTTPCSPEEGWTRVIVEKPFGEDAKTAQNLDALLGKLFREVQIYRIDHYLAKEMLQNILLFRFTNNLFERNWDRESIEGIHIKLWEKIGVEDRGKFYDGVGALRDVGQNHLLQELAFITMDRPESFQGEVVRQKRAEILKTLKIPTLSEIKKSTLRGQYRGYHAITGVRAQSKTETYFKISVFLSSPRWQGVPITLESGKRLGKQQKEITVTLRHDTPCFCPDGEHYSNTVVFTLEPEERITIHFWSKKPGLDATLEKRTFDFLYRGSEKKTQYVEEYGKLLLDCIAGDQTLFISTDEVRAMWNFIDPIIGAWGRNAVPLLLYEPDTDAIAANSVEEKLLKPKKLKKEIGIIGLGKMGLPLALRLQSRGWRVIGFDQDPRARAKAHAEGVIVCERLSDLTEKCISPRVVWVMVPAFANASAGKPAENPVDKILFEKNGLTDLQRGDVVIDAGNSFYKDSVRRGRVLAKRGVHFLDIGVSGGPKGAETGSALMVGGDERAYQKIEPLLYDLAKPQGYGYVGKVGAGHFAKMIHNGIEYGMMQAIAEGFTILKKSAFRFDLARVAGIYNHGSVIESRLMQWLEGALQAHDQELHGVSGSVGATGEGEWTANTAHEMKMPAPVIASAVLFRKKSKKSPSYTGKILSALRNQFGGHSITSL